MYYINVLYNVLSQAQSPPWTSLSALQNAKYVWNKAEFDAVKPENTDFLMGKKKRVGIINNL